MGQAAIIGRIALLLLALAAPFHGQAQLCEARSGPHTTALVELYTSARCAGCSHAERWLSRLGTRESVPTRVVPVALHVDYRDYVQGNDAYARGQSSHRQRRLTQAQRLALLYTPRVLLQGHDFRDWDNAAFEEAVSRINQRPEAARIALEIAGVNAEGFRVHVRAALSGSAGSGHAVVYLAAYGTRTPAHDYVVLEWQGPLALSSGTLQTERLLPLLPRALPSNSGVVAFVQNRRTGEVLQALMLPACG